jgi:hypothetical protein
MILKDSIEFSGNVLDLVHLGDGSDMTIVSIDGLHQPGSTQTLRNDTNTPQTFLEGFTLQWRDDQSFLSRSSSGYLVDGINQYGSSSIPESKDEKSKTKLEKEISVALYDTDIFRKRLSGDGA